MLARLHPIYDILNNNCTVLFWGDMRYVQTNKDAQHLDTLKMIMLFVLNPITMLMVRPNTIFFGAATRQQPFT